MRPVCVRGFCDGEIFWSEEDRGDAIEGKEFPSKWGRVGGAAREILDCGGGGAGGREEVRAGEEFEGVVVWGGFGLDEEGAPGGVGRWSEFVGGGAGWGEGTA